MTNLITSLSMILTLIPSWVFILIIFVLITCFFVYIRIISQKCIITQSKLSELEAKESDNKINNNKLTKILAIGIIDKHNLHTQKLRSLYENKTILQMDIIDQMINKLVYEFKQSYTETANIVNSNLAIKFDGSHIHEQVLLYTHIIENVLYIEIKDNLRSMLKDATWSTLNYDDWESFKKEKFDQVLTTIKSRIQDEYPSSMAVPVIDRMSYFENTVKKNFYNVFSQSFDKIKETQIKYLDDESKNKKKFDETLDEYIKNGFSF